MDFDVMVRYLPAILPAAGLTIGFTLVTIAIATAVGLWTATLTYSRRLSVRFVTRAYIETGRNIPALVVLYLVFYVSPEFGLTLDPFVAGVVGLVWVFGAFLTEVFRAGIESVPKTQWEAGTVLGMSSGTTWRRIVLPQAVRAVLPVWASYFLILYKTTALLAFITVPELFGTVRNIAATNFRFFELFTLAGILYFAMGYPTILLVKRLERHWASALRPVDRPQADVGRIATRSPL